MEEFLTGIFYLARGFNLMLNPKLRSFIVAPLIINVIFFGLLFYFSTHLFSELISYLLQFLPHWLQWLKSIFWLVFLLGSFIFFYFTFLLVASFIAAPFNGLLAEKTVEYLGYSLKQQSIWKTIKEAPKMFAREINKWIYYFPRVLLVLILFIIPGMQIIAPFAWFLFSAKMLSLQYLDYPADNEKVDFHSLIRSLQGKMGYAYGFGCGITLVLLIPLLNFFVMPAAVIGATCLWRERIIEIKRKNYS